MTCPLVSGPSSNASQFGTSGSSPPAPGLAVALARVCVMRTLLAEVYAGTSARAVAATGRFSAALIICHFGSVDALLLAVLDRVSRDRLVRY
jgi:hypothetical protein